MHLFTFAAGNELGQWLINFRVCGHKPEGLVEQETLIIITSRDSICYHHFQLTPLIISYKDCDFGIFSIYKCGAAASTVAQTS